MLLELDVTIDDSGLRVKKIFQVTSVIWSSLYSKKKGLKADLLSLVYEKGSKDPGTGMGDNDRLTSTGKANIRVERQSNDPSRLKLTKVLNNQNRNVNYLGDLEIKSSLIYFLTFSAKLG